MPKGFLYPPDDPALSREMYHWMWVVTVTKWALVAFALWAIGVGELVGVPFPGFAYQSQAQANAQAVTDLKLVVKCTALQSSIDAVRRDLYAVQREIDVAGQGAREMDRQQLARLSADLMDRQARFTALGCPAALN